MKTSFEFQEKMAPWFCLFLGLAIIIGVVCFLPGCASQNIPPIDVSFWAGDSKLGGITRDQDNLVVACDTPEFDRYTCITYEDVQKIYNTMLECRDWPRLASVKEKNEMNQKNAEVIRYVRYGRTQKALEPLRR